MFASISSNCAVLYCQFLQCWPVMQHKERVFFFGDTVNPSLTCAIVKLALSSCDRCHFEASQALFSHGTKCVIIVEAVANSLLFPSIPRTTPLTLLWKIRKSSMNNAEMEICHLCAKHSSVESASPSCDSFFFVFGCIWYKYNLCKICGTSD